MTANGIYDYTEVNFAGKQYKFIKETPPKSLQKPKKQRSKSVFSPLIEEIPTFEEILPVSEREKTPKSPRNVLFYDIERVKQFGELPNARYRTAHVELLSPKEEKRVLEMLKIPGKQGDLVGKKRNIEYKSDIRDVFRYFDEIKRYNRGEKETVRLPKLAGHRRLVSTRHS